MFSLKKHFNNCMLKTYKKNSETRAWLKKPFHMYVKILVSFEHCFYLHVYIIFQNISHPVSNQSDSLDAKIGRQV